MGKHQWLPNGNLLVTESAAGRAFELNSDKQIVWEFINLTGTGTVGIVQEVQRIPQEMAQVFATATCP